MSETGHMQEGDARKLGCDGTPSPVPRMQVSAQATLGLRIEQMAEQ